MWTSQGTGASTQRTANTNSADTIHLHIKGADAVANWHLAQVKRFSIPVSYYNTKVS